MSTGRSKQSEIKNQVALLKKASAARHVVKRDNSLGRNSRNKDLSALGAPRFPSNPTGARKPVV